MFTKERPAEPAKETAKRQRLSVSDRVARIDSVILAHEKALARLRGKRTELIERERAKVQDALRQIEEATGPIPHRD